MGPMKASMPICSKWLLWQNTCFIVNTHAGNVLQYSLVASTTLLSTAYEVVFFFAMHTVRWPGTLATNY